MPDAERTRGTWFSLTRPTLALLCPEHYMTTGGAGYATANTAPVRSEGPKPAGTSALITPAQAP
jgi:hypothetical protein